MDYMQLGAGPMMFRALTLLGYRLRQRALQLCQPILGLSPADPYGWQDNSGKG